MMKAQAASRVIWSARRGILELDLIFQSYIKQYYINDSAAEKAAFHDLLTCEDQDLFAWFIQQTPAATQHQPIVKKILSIRPQPMK